MWNSVDRDWQSNDRKNQDVTEKGKVLKYNLTIIFPNLDATKKNSCVIHIIPEKSRLAQLRTLLLFTLSNPIFTFSGNYNSLIATKYSTGNA